MTINGAFTEDRIREALFTISLQALRKASFASFRLPISI